MCATRLKRGVNERFGNTGLAKKEEYFSRKDAKAQRREALPRFLRVSLRLGAFAQEPELLTHLMEARGVKQSQTLGSFWIERDRLRGFTSCG
jgi:hypothetical protein